MKILLTNWVYNWGSTGYICRDIKTSLEAKGHEVVVAAAFDWGRPRSGVFTFCTLIERVIAVLLNKFGFSKFNGSPLSTFRLINFIKKEKPDVVHVHLLNNQCCNMYKVFKWLGEQKIKTVITHHSEILYTGCCSHSYDCDLWIEKKCMKCGIPHYVTGSNYNANPHRMWLCMENAFSYFKPENVIMTAVSPWVENRSKLSQYLRPFECITVFNGVDTGVFCRKSVYDSSILFSLPCDFRNYAIFVSAGFNPSDKGDIKGGYFLIELAKKMPERNFLVVATSQNIEISMPANVFVWGRASSQEELAILYSNASLTVLTSKKETFSMVCAESLCCGTPVVGFNAGGPESISIPEYSRFVEQGNIEALAAAIREIEKQSMNRGEISQKASLLYSKEVMSLKYLEVYKKLCEA